MQLTKEQIQRFIEINSGIPEFDKCSEEEKVEIANGVANYYSTMFKIYRELENKAEGKTQSNVEEYCD